MSSLVKPKFIEVSGTTVTVDGNFGNVPKTTFYDGESAVQLKHTKGFDWNGREITHVTLKNVIIYDRSDITCLVEFISKNILIEGSEAFVSPDASLVELETAIDTLKAKEGSIIKIPHLNGLSSMSKTEAFEAIFKKAGFKTTF